MSGNALHGGAPGAPGAARALHDVPRRAVPGARGGEPGMPIRGIVNTAHALAWHAMRQEVVANNLANANTDAFKADRLVARLEADTGFPLPVRHVDLQQGSFRDTGRALDVALDGPGFLVVETAAGERLTRGGSLALDADGRLVDAHGDPVLDEHGPVVALGAELVVEPDGTVLVDGAAAGRLRLVVPDDPQALLKEGAGRFVAGGPVHAAGPDTVRVRQGSVEEPNLDALLSMVDLITIQRAYLSNLDALRAMDGVLGVIAGEVGKV